MAADSVASGVLHPSILPLELARRLDPLCDRFEDDWLAGRRPRLEDFLDRVLPADRPALLAELLGLELDYRLRRGELVEAEDYHRRLPGCDEVIEAAFASLTVPADTSLNSALSRIVHRGILRFVLNALRHH